MILLFFLVIISIFAVGLMKGKMNYCMDDNVDSELMALVITKWDCLSVGGEWQTRG